MMDVPDIQHFLDDNFAPWVLALAPTVHDAGPDGVTLDMPITPDIARVGGIVSGQALTAMADTAMVLATAVHLGRLAPVATVTLDTQFLRPATGDTILAEAEITRAGRALIFARCTLSALPMGKAVALATATFAVPD
ncbi:PaaI family thioesterase [uncultured Tateyamaria sp.]|uniref:PaaI family thioesterase n=1 Tax=uncultured Tateyamaria sp. TaxID=455651 RepID=UPI00263716C7|nr:PaaI family thioesterase [uncultured Tateyamaria sp.]